MAIGKILLNGVTQIDLTQDTVSDAEHIKSGFIGHLNNGTQVTGTYQGEGGGASIRVEQLPGGGEHYIINGTPSTSNVEYGTFTVASDIEVTDAGVTVNVGFSGQPDYIYVWMDKNTYEGLGTWENNRWYKFALSKNDSTVISTFPYQRGTSSQDLQTRYANSTYIRAVQHNVLTSSDENNPTGYAVGASLAYYDRNNTVDAINSNGTITIARTGVYTQYLLAGTYHYYAVTGMFVFPS